MEVWTTYLAAVLSSRIEQPRNSRQEATRADVQIVEGVGHVFDHDPSLGVIDFGQRWQGVVKGMDWLIQHCQTQDTSA